MFCGEKSTRIESERERERESERERERERERARERKSACKEKRENIVETACAK